MLVRPGARFLDVGTDHAYLPVYLSFHCLVSFCAATDIAQGPLKKAKEHIELWNMTDRIRTRQAPGLLGAEDFAPTDIALAAWRRIDRFLWKRLPLSKTRTFG